MQSLRCIQCLLILLTSFQIQAEDWTDLQIDVGDYDDLDASELISDLESSEYDINEQDSSGSTALHLAGVLNRPNMAKILKDYGADLEVRDEFGYTPLHIAVGMEHLDVVKVLLAGSRRSNVNAVTKKLWTALHIAVGMNSSEATILLLVNGADVNAQDYTGWTPLHLAALSGYVDLAKMLIIFPRLRGSYCKINAQDLTGCTALHIAARNRHKSLVDLLLKAKADAKIINVNNQTVRDEALALNYNEIVTLLDRRVE